MRLLTIALVSCGAVALACGGASQDGLFAPMGETGGASPWASAGGVVAVGGGTSAGGIGSGGVPGGGVTGSGGVAGGGGFVGNGGASAAGGSLGAAGGNTSAGGGGLTDAGLGGGGVSGNGGIGNGAGGFTGGGTGGASRGGATADAGPLGAGGASNVVCPTGEYKPTLTGPYKSISGTKDIGATIDFTISDAGVVQGTFSGPGNAKATISGTIDCATGALTAEILNGTYPVGLTTVKFSGTITGTYDARVGGFTGGTWTITEPANSRNGGTGTW